MEAIVIYEHQHCIGRAPPCGVKPGTPTDRIAFPRDLPRAQGTWGNYRVLQVSMNVIASRQLRYLTFGVYGLNVVDEQCLE